MSKRSLYYDRTDENGIDLDLPQPEPPKPFRYEKSDRIAEGFVRVQVRITDFLQRHEALLSKFVLRIVGLKQRYNETIQWAQTDGPAVVARVGAVAVLTGAVYQSYRASSLKAKIGMPLVYGLGGLLVAFPPSNNEHYIKAVAWTGQLVDHRIAGKPYAEVISGLARLWEWSENIVADTLARAHGMAEKFGISFD